MFTAIDAKDGKKIPPMKDAVAHCELCGAPVYVKALDSLKVIPHYSHYHGANCDAWNEPESDWHKYWKEVVPIEQREVVIVRDDQKHRADIYLPTVDVVIELQHSTITTAVRKARDGFYKRLIWLIHKTQIHKYKLLEDDPARPQYCNATLLANPFSWVIIQNSVTPMFIDLLDETMFHIKQIARGKEKGSFVFYGDIVTKAQFIKEFMVDTKFNYDDLKLVTQRVYDDGVYLTCPNAKCVLNKKTCLVCVSTEFCVFTDVILQLPGLTTNVPIPWFCKYTYSLDDNVIDPNICNYELDVCKKCNTVFKRYKFDLTLPVISDSWYWESDEIKQRQRLLVENKRLQREELAIRLDRDPVFAHEFYYKPVTCTRMADGDYSILRAIARRTMLRGKK